MPGFSPKTALSRLPVALLRFSSGDNRACFTVMINKKTKEVQLCLNRLRSQHCIIVIDLLHVYNGSLTPTWL